MTEHEEQKKSRGWILFILLIVAVFFCDRMIRRTPAASPSATPSEVQMTQPEIAATPVPYELDNNQLFTLRQELNEDKIINPDVQAVLLFQSELIHQPVLQSEDNDYYLYRNWQTKEHQSYGSIVLDYQNQLEQDDMNTILYGHYVYERANADRTLAFTPLEKLQEQQNYEANKYVVLLTEADVRYYEIARVYECPMVDTDTGQVAVPELRFNVTTYDADYFQSYLEAMEEHSYYDTGVDLVYGDRLLTLQTCIEDHPESRLVIVCRLITCEDFPQD